MTKRKFIILILAALSICYFFNLNASAVSKDFSISQAQANKIIELISATIDGQQTPSVPELEIEFKNPVIVGWQSKDGSYRFVAAQGTNLKEAIISASQKMADLGKIPQDSRLYASVILSYSSLPENKKNVFANGLFGLGYNSMGQTCFIPPEIIFYRAIGLNQAKRILKEQPPCCIEGSFGQNGFFRFKSQSMVERQDGSVALLFRGNYTIKPEEVTSENVRKHIKLGADFLVRLIREDGQYYYQYDPRVDKLEAVSYNLLRHAGTTYSLYQVCRHLADMQYCDAAERTWEWLVNKVKTEKVGDKTIAYPEYREKIKLGGVGLMLIAMAERAKATGRYDKELARKLVNFVEFMQKPNGDVYYYYTPHKGNQGRSDEHKAFYYPGEATLGLVRIYQIEKDPEILRIAKKTADFLVDKRWKILGIEITVPPDAWLTMALCELYQIERNSKYAKYAFKLADRMISEQHEDAPYPDYVGGFAGMPPGVTPTGGRMEAITAAYYLAKELNMDTTKFLNSIKKAARFQMNCIVREEDSFFYPNPTFALGIFRKSATSHEARIDYNQHNLSSLLFTMKILSENKK